MEHPDALVLGARTFDRAVPLRSRIGNILTRRLMQALIGAKLQDTQTGLRGIPAAHVRARCCGWKRAATSSSWRC